MELLRQERGFTLLELLVAVTVAAVLTTVSLNAYAMFHHAVSETTLRYGLFAGRQVQDLRCRTRFVRGLPPNAPPCTVPCDSARFAPSRTDVRARF